METQVVTVNSYTRPNANNKNVIQVGREKDIQLCESIYEGTLSFGKEKDDTYTISLKGVHKLEDYSKEYFLNVRFNPDADRNTYLDKKRHSLCTSFKNEEDCDGLTANIIINRSWSEEDGSLMFRFEKINKAEGDVIAAYFILPVSECQMFLNFLSNIK